MRWFQPRLSRLWVLMTLALVAGACGGGGPDPFEIGFRRVALDLAFKDADKAPPIAPRRALEQLQFEESEIIEALDEEPPLVRRPRTVSPPRAPKFVCETADPNATPAVPAFPVVKDPPTVGVYPRHNVGTIGIEIGTQNVKLPYPAATKWTVADVRSVTASTYLNADEAESLKLPPTARDNTTAFPPRTEFSITRTARRGFSTTDTYRYSGGGTTGGDYIWLIRRVTEANGVKSTFNPTPPIRVVETFSPEGPDSDVNHGGVDRATNVALAIQSTVVGREWVDVCGEVHDTYRVQIKETMVDLSKNPPEVSGNEGDSVNFWNIQFDNGVLIIREEAHTTQRTSVTTTVNGQQARVPVAVRYDYVSTLDSILPTPLTAAADPAAETEPDEDEEDA